MRRLDDHTAHPPALGAPPPRGAPPAPGGRPTLGAPPALGGRPGPAGRRGLSPRTLQFYARDWAEFVAWCRSTGADAGAGPLPATAETIAAYLTEASARLGPGALARRLAAIADQHRRRGLQAPIADPAVKAVLRRARRAHRSAHGARGGPHRDRSPASTVVAPARVAGMIASCPGDLAGLRDRALLLLFQATGLGRAALLSLDAENLRLGAAAEIRIALDGNGQSFALSRNPDLQRCPVRALEHWLHASDTDFGPVFRKVDRWGNVAYPRLGTDAVRRILLRRSPRGSHRSHRPRQGETSESAKPGEQT